ncbi:MAG: hypothetical protein J5496_06535 [Lachnospiraceae bacterium]|nr:hypothetical protein [Lachnospiraceae bacterium]
MKRFVLIVFSLLFCLALAACGSNSFRDSSREEDTTAHSKKAAADSAAENGTASSGNFWQDLIDGNKESADIPATKAPDTVPADVRKECFSAYYLFLQENKDTTWGTYYFFSQNKQYNIYEAIMFWDLTGDGLPEMLVLSPRRNGPGSDAVSLVIYTGVGGNVRELKTQDGTVAVPVFWDQMNFYDMTDSVCFSDGASLYVYSVRRENGGAWLRETETLLRLFCDSDSSTVTADPVLNSEKMLASGGSSHWYSDGRETDQEKYEEQKAALFEKVEACLLYPLSYSQNWDAYRDDRIRAGDGLPTETLSERTTLAGRSVMMDRKVIANRLGMRYIDALHYLAGEIEAAEEEPAEQPEILTFGSYEQDGNPDNGPEPIEWLVLTKENGKALLLSRCGLEYQYLDASSVRFTWASSSIREWLNGTFLSGSFSDEELARILLTPVITEDNPSYGKPGNTIRTEDSVFLLSNQEVEAYLTTHFLRICEPTAFAHKLGCLPGLGGGAAWILRSWGGYGSLSVSYIDPWGYHDTQGTNVDNREAIRPAMWIELDE